MNKKITIKISEKEGFEVRELLISLVDSKYATESQSKTLVNIINQIGE